MAKNITIKNAAEKFAKELEELGKKASTVNTSKRCLELFVAHQGEDKQVGKIMPVHVAAFFKSEAATMRNDKPRAQASIMQIRRITRQFLIWCVEQKYVDKLPLTKDEAAKGGGVRIPKDQDESDRTEDNPEAQHNEAD